MHLFIASTPRSGSSLISDLFVSQGWLHERQELLIHWVKHSQSQGMDIPEILSHRISNYTIGSHFCTKVMWKDFKPFIPHVRQLQDVRFLHIYRRNKLAQAISLTKAKQTGRWHSFDKPYDNAQFSGLEVGYHKHILEQWETAWSNWLHEQQLPWISVCYEDFLSDPAQTALQISSLLPSSNSWISAFDQHSKFYSFMGRLAAPIMPFYLRMKYPPKYYSYA